MKILSIEDDPGICILLKRLLKEAGVVCSDFRCVGTLAAGKDEAVSFFPDLILLDLKLPDSPSGDESIEAIPFLKSIAPVIVLSGKAEVSFVPCMQAGASDCLDKSIYVLPRNMAFLAHVIARAIILSTTCER